MTSSCVVTHPDHRIGSQFGSGLQHQVKRGFARLFTKLCQQNDVAADNYLQVAPIVPTVDRERTMIPCTSPRLWTME
jgi:hypothetical protein